MPWGDRRAKAAPAAASRVGAEHAVLPAARHRGGVDRSPRGLSEVAHEAVLLTGEDVDDVSPLPGAVTGADWRLIAVSGPRLP